MRRIKFRGKTLDQSQLYFYIDHLLNNKLLMNRAFDRLITNSISFLEDNGYALNRDYTIDVHISQNGERLTMRSNIGDSCKFKNTNNGYRQVVINLDDDLGLNILYSSGYAFSTSDYNRVSEKKVTDSLTVCHVEYNQGHYLQNGIKTYDSSYSDDYPVNYGFTDIQNIQNTTVFHTPTFWKENDIPEVEKTGINARRSIVYRDNGQLGIIHLLEVYDGLGKFKEIYSADEEARNGDIWRKRIIALWDDEARKMVPSERSKRLYPEKTTEEICEIENNKYLGSWNYTSDDDLNNIVVFPSISK